VVVEETKHQFVDILKRGDKMVFHQLYGRDKGTKRWYKWGYPNTYEIIKAEYNAFKKSKKYKGIEFKMKRAYPKKRR